MIGLIGKKIGMTQYFSDAGEAIPVTVIEVGPCTVTEVRTPERDGYAAIQLGFGANKESRYTRPVLGQFKKRNLPPSRFLKEFRVADLTGVEVGQKLTVTLFEKGQHVDKKSREQFEIRIHKRLIDITRSTAQTMEALEKLDIPAGVDIEIKT